MGLTLWSCTLTVEVRTVTQTRVFVADSHADLQKRLNEWLKKHRRADVRFLQLVTQGEHNYALLVAWEEE